MDYGGVETAKVALRRADAAVAECDARRQLAVKHIDSLIENYER